MNIILIIFGIIVLLYAFLLFQMKRWSLTTLFFEPIFFEDYTFLEKLLFIPFYFQKALLYFILGIIIIYLGIK